MSLAPFQREIARLIARNRVASGESYVAGGAAFSELLGSMRLSRDIDVFSDTAEAVQAGWDADRAVLEAAGLRVSATRERSTFVEAAVSRGSDSAVLQWAQDSAFRFFPLVEHPDLGLSLHPFDLATNKVLALVGRAEPRDWVDVIHADRVLQPFGYLVWAAVGKDPGMGPGFVLNEAARSGRYTDTELGAVEFDGPRPSARDLALRWHEMLCEAGAVVRLLPETTAGTCVLTREGDPAVARAEVLAKVLEEDGLTFHMGCLFGSYPSVRPV